MTSTQASVVVSSNRVRIASPMLSKLCGTVASQLAPMQAHIMREVVAPLAPTTFHSSSSPAAPSPM